MMPWIMGAAMLRAGGEVWVKLLRVAQVVQEATLRQMRVFWGFAHPVAVANICAPDGPAKPRAPRRKQPEAEMNDVPV